MSDIHPDHRRQRWTIRPDRAGQLTLRINGKSCGHIRDIQYIDPTSLEIELANGDHVELRTHHRHPSAESTAEAKPDFSRPVISFRSGRSREPLEPTAPAMPSSDLEARRGRRAWEWHDLLVLGFATVVGACVMYAGYTGFMATMVKRAGQ